MWWGGEVVFRCHMKQLGGFLAPFVLASIRTRRQILLPVGARRGRWQKMREWWARNMAWTSKVAVEFDEGFIVK